LTWLGLGRHWGGSSTWGPDCGSRALHTCVIQTQDNDEQQIHGRRNQEACRIFYSAFMFCVANQPKHRRPWTTTPARSVQRSRRIFQPYLWWAAWIAASSHISRGLHTRCHTCEETERTSEDGVGASLGRPGRGSREATPVVSHHDAQGCRDGQQGLKGACGHWHGGNALQDLQVSQSWRFCSQQCSDMFQESHECV
jgi:hypothetical protein